MISLLFALAVVAQAPDSAWKARFQLVLKQATDSLGGVRGAVAGFRNDLSSASSELVLARAARLHVSCRGADAALVEVQSLLAGGAYTHNAKREQTQLRNETVELRRVLARCEREWAVPQRPSTAAADTLRAWGPYRTDRLDRSLQFYLGALRGFMRKVGFRNPS